MERRFEDKSHAKALAPKIRINTFARGVMETEAVPAGAQSKAGRHELVLGGTR
jgi:hypothetical protein